MTTTAADVPTSDLVRIAVSAQVFKLMGERRTRQVTIDYSPARDALLVPRESGEDAPLEPITPDVIPITFTLEDAMFGGSVWVALTCGERVVVHPFAWVSYEHLATIVVNTR